MAERVDGTCMWLLEHEHFRSWLAQESGPLLITADPGCGKSVLAKYLIDHGLPRSSNICYFFFQDHDQNTVRQALCALLHQLFYQQPSLIQYALPYYSIDGKGLINSTRSLWEILQTAIQDSQAKPLIVVLDALDECAEPEFEDLMRKIKSQVRSSQPGSSSLKYILMSRPYGQITSQFWDLLDAFPKIRIPGEEESETISQEVDRVITYRLNQLPTKDLAKGQAEGLPPEIKKHLQKRLQETTHRTYLWVYLVFDYFAKETFKKTIKGVDSAIKTLPKSINEAYEQILSKSKEHATVRKVLCIILAASRPLTLAEMNIAINMDDTYQSTDDLDLEDEQDLKTRLRSLCGLFISVHHDKIYFLHQTAREFLIAKFVSPTTTPSKSCWHSSITTCQAHTVLAKACVLYLDLFNSQLSPPDNNEIALESATARYPFLEYSARSWGSHFYEANFLDDDAIVPYALGICDPASRCYLWWFLIFCEGDERPTDFTPLGLVSQFGHVVLVRQLLEKGAEVDARDSEYGRTPLLWAAISGHEAVVQLLLEKGADIEAKDRIFKLTPLAYAADSGDKAMVKLLLESGADVGPFDESGRTPLSWATEPGNEAVVKLLLEAEASLEARGR